MEAAITKINLVLIGRFQPNKFMPNELAKAKVISQKTSELAQFVTLIPGQEVSYSFGWGVLEVSEERLVIHSLEAPHVRICDAVVKAIREVAPESVISRFGINVECHYDLGSADARNKLGVRLVPPEAWGSWGKEILQTMEGEFKGTPLQGGLMTVLMRNPFAHSNGLYGWRDITVAPSPEIKTEGGVWCRANHHHQLKGLVPEEGQAEIPEPVYDFTSTNLLLDVLVGEFEQSIEASTSVFDEVLSQ